jgi:hypothetical protein
MSHPLLYEINARGWLRELSNANRREITLAEVPDSEFLCWQRFGFTHIWLMGVWTSGPRAHAQALTSAALMRAYSEALPGWTHEDVGASPYSIAAYQVSEVLGGNDGLGAFRQKLHSFGLKLVLDFVPNHLGVDHPWVEDRPEVFVHSTSPAPGTFSRDTASGALHLAFGKDPYWAPWTDTVQLDYRRAETRAAMTSLLLEIAERCEGVRCDMAMLLLNDVFVSTWKDFPTKESCPKTEFWADAIAATRQHRTEFLFLAEVYWGMESRLQQLGFDYTYDKVLYDKLVSPESGAVQRHLLGMPEDCLSAGAHFLENHDEPRVASLLAMPEHRAAALVILGLPGMRFLHEGQLRGLRIRLPVQLIGRGQEPEDPAIRSMYERLLGVLLDSLVGQGTPVLTTPREAWANNPTAQNFILVQWVSTAATFDLVAVNLAPHASQCYAPVKLTGGLVESWAVTDLAGSDRFIRSGDDLSKRGLYLDLPAYGGQILHFEPMAGPS